jgi:hypothetical protein
MGVPVYVSRHCEFVRDVHAAARGYVRIEDLNLNPAMSVLLLLASLPDCTQNQTAVSDTLRLLLSDF